MDDHQDIARSSYADMLHDDERNHAYLIAIRANVNHLVRSCEMNPSGDRFYKCCDIGTGSGLLSMMIVRTFRELNYEHFHVTAFEAFKPMAECARKVIAANGMSDRITVISGRSEEYQKPNPQFDLLVAELLDTELIGEGCLLTYRHAVQHLCSTSCIFIPSEAHIFIQPLDCEQLYVRNTLRTKLKVQHSSCLECPGLAEIDDMQLSQVDKSYAIDKLSPPKRVFSFRFHQLDSLKLRQTLWADFKFPSNKAANFLVIGMWWDIVMYDETLYTKYLDPIEHPHSFSTLSCAPNWHRRQQFGERDRYIELAYGREVWREHWIQGVYYLRDSPSKLRQIPAEGEEGLSLLMLNAHHDSHSLWFTLGGPGSVQGKQAPDACYCGVHRQLARPEMAFLASEAFEKLCCAAARNGEEEHEGECAGMALEFTEAGRLAGASCDKYFAVRTTPSGSRRHVHQIDHALQDEVSYARVLRNLLAGGSARAHPIKRLSLKCKQVCFKSLNRIRTRVGHCQGFDLTHLDELIERSARLVDASTEAHNLLEYEHQAIFPDEPPIELLSLGGGGGERRAAASAPPEDWTFSRSIELRLPATSDWRRKLRQGWAVIFWPDFYLNSSARDAAAERLDLMSELSSSASSSASSRPAHAHFRHLVHFLHDHPALREGAANASIKLMVDVTLEGIHVTRL